MSTDYNKKRYLQLLDQIDQRRIGDNSNDDELSRYSCMLTNQLDWEIRDQYLSLMENFLNGNMSMPEFFAELRIKNYAIIDAVTFLERHQILLSFDKKASKFGELLEDVIDELEGDISDTGDESIHNPSQEIVSLRNSLNMSLVLEFISDNKFRRLVSIPESSAKKIKNKWIAEVWVSDEFFVYIQPFLFTNYFRKKKMSIDEFSVIFEIIQKFCVVNLNKKMYIKKFFNSYPSKHTLNGHRKKKIKNLFIYYINQLYNGKHITTYPITYKRLIRLKDNDFWVLRNRTFYD